ncbi:MAG: DnaB-like helicase C-terminal domain-containing protein [Eubacteriales bacterium]
MTKEQARELGKTYLEDYVNRITEKSKGELYQCPLCGSGTRNSHDSDGAFGIYRKGDESKWKCQACEEGGDIYDLVAKHEGLPVAEAFQRVYQLYYIQVDYDTNNYTLNRSEIIKMFDENPLPEQQNTIPPYIPSQPMQQPQIPLPQLRADYRQYVLDGMRKLNESPEALEYLHGRGFDRNVLESFRIGYDPYKGIIIPYNEECSYFVNRSIRGKEYRKPKSNEAGAEPIFNQVALYGPHEMPVFVVESQLCAISIEQAGGKAIAIGGSGSKKLIDQLQTTPSNKTLILSLDNDTAGQDTTERIKKALLELNHPHIVLNASGGYKDPNDHLQANRGEFERIVRNPYGEITNQYRKQYSAVSQIKGFINGIAASVNTAYIPTGFDQLDEILDGGLFEGLYVIGAISSLGKTTLTLQICDNIASQGKDVLFFSLEMASSEIMAKSISRESLMEVICTGGNVRHAKTTRGITTGKRWGSYCQDEKMLISKAVENYEKYAQHVFIYEGVGSIGIEEITSIVKQHIAITNEIPVVVIDYLQIIAPHEPRATDKQNTDKAVLELKRLSRDYKLPVFAISSFNRDNYKAEVNMASFKESGAIEYSSDVLIGLQYRGMSDKTAEAKTILAKAQENAKEGRAVEVEMKILKNRNGSKGSLYFDFYPMFNMFKEGT